MPEKLIPDRYLGDGVYASYDGYHILLDLRAEPPPVSILCSEFGLPAKTRIALDPPVLEMLDQYRREIQAAIERAQEADRG